MTGIKTYSTQITEFIKQSILAGELNPGDKINEVHVAARLSISRAPVREALQSLVQEGLVVSSPQRGKFIASLSAKEIQDSYFTGGVLEGAAVASTIDRFTDDDLGKLQDIVDQMKHVAESGQNGDKLAPLDDDFHSLLFSKTHNNLLIELSRRSCQGLSKFLFFKYWRKLFTPREVYLRHQKVVDSVKSKNHVEIERTIREHYIESGERMKKYGKD